jgi:oligopeptidase A
MFKEFILDDFENSAKNLEILIDENKKELEELLKIEEKNYDNFVVPYQFMSEKLEQFCTPIFHIDSVKNSETTQKIYNECLPLISIYSSQLSSNEKVYTSFKDIQYKYNSSLNIEQQKVLENEIRDFALGGCGLNDAQKQELEKINLELSELGQKFSQNILDATNAWEMIVENEEDIKEVPKSDLESAKFKDEDGKVKYKFTLQMPSYIAYITYGTNRAKREEIYKAYSTRAPQNGQLIEKILKLKKQEAQLLGLKTMHNSPLLQKWHQVKMKLSTFCMN